jgi:hypothetical protein
MYLMLGLYVCGVVSCVALFLLLRLASSFLLAFLRYFDKPKVRGNQYYSRE